MAKPPSHKTRCLIFLAIGSFAVGFGDMPAALLAFALAMLEPADG